MGLSAGGAGAAAELLEALRERLGERVIEAAAPLGDATILLAREEPAATFAELRDDPALRFDLLADLTAVDYLGRVPRFEVVVHLRSFPLGHRLRVKRRVPEDDPRVPTLAGVWKAANWLERECWDLYGIRFDGHPDLRRILMYPEFEGHPLRKDYPVMKRQPIIPERDPVENPWPRRPTFEEEAE